MIMTTNLYLPRFPTILESTFGFTLFFIYYIKNINLYQIFPSINLDSKLLYAY